MQVVPLASPYRAEVIDHILSEWGDPIISKGEALDVRHLPGLVWLDGESVGGALLYRIQLGECEIVVLFSNRQASGVGTALIDEVVQIARSAGCSRVWLITTNDNTPAIRYYQRRGFALSAVYWNGFARTLALKQPPITGPVLGIDEIPIVHELEFERLLEGE